MGLFAFRRLREREAMAAAAAEAIGKKATDLKEADKSQKKRSYTKRAKSTPSTLEQ